MPNENPITRLEKIADRQEKLNDRSERQIIIRRSVIIWCVLFFALNIALFVGLVQQNYAAREANRDLQLTLLRSIVPMNLAIETDDLSRAQRMERYMRKAKAWIWEHHPRSCTMTSYQLDALLIENFTLAEESRTISPYYFIAYTSLLSGFDYLSTGYMSRRGLVQMLPTQAQDLLGEKYYEWCEFEPVMACRAWYAFYRQAAAKYKHDIKWIAAEYATSNNAGYSYSNGLTVEAYMKQYKEQTGGKQIVIETYPSDIERVIVNIKVYCLNIDEIMRR